MCLYVFLKVSAFRHFYIFCFKKHYIQINKVILVTISAIISFIRIRKKFLLSHIYRNILFRPLGLSTFRVITCAFVSGKTTRICCSRFNHQDFTKNMVWSRKFKNLNTEKFYWIWSFYSDARKKSSFRSSYSLK